MDKRPAISMAETVCEATVGSNGITCTIQDDVLRYPPQDLFTILDLLPLRSTGTIMTTRVEAGTSRYPGAGVSERVHLPSADVRNDMKSNENI